MRQDEIRAHEETIRLLREMAVAPIVGAGIAITAQLPVYVVVMALVGLLMAGMVLVASGKDAASSIGGGE